MEEYEYEVAPTTCIESVAGLKNHSVGFNCRSNKKKCIVDKKEADYCDGCKDDLKIITFTKKKFIENETIVIECTKYSKRYVCCGHDHYVLINTYVLVTNYGRIIEIVDSIEEWYKGKWAGKCGFYCELNTWIDPKTIDCINSIIKNESYLSAKSINSILTIDNAKCKALEEKNKLLELEILKLKQENETLAQKDKD